MTKFRKATALRKGDRISFVYHGTGSNAGDRARFTAEVKAISPGKRDDVLLIVEPDGYYASRQREVCMPLARLHDIQTVTA